MLTAYFDDSGTHDPSQIVIIGGLFGTEAQWATLEDAWGKLLAVPLEGQKPTINRFHMTNCYNSTEEFAGWSRTETDYFCRQLQDIIIASGVAGYAIGCLKSAWDELVTGDARVCLGDAEGFCVRSCFVEAVDWARQHSTEPDISFVFDDRPRRKSENRILFDAFQRSELSPPSLVGISFITSHKIFPLQAADMVAWEFYQYARTLIQAGRDMERRPQIYRLVQNVRYRFLFGYRSNIESIVASLWQDGAKTVELMANHFKTFDPD
jgi:hypothetical protein